MTEPFAERGARSVEAAHRLGAGSLVASHVGTVRWLTGFAPDLESMLAPWSAGTHVVLMEGETHVIAAAEDAAGIRVPDATVHTYEGFGVMPEIGAYDQAAETLGAVLADIGIGTWDRVAVERRALTLAVGGGLTGRPVIDASQALRELRAIKDPSEIAQIRRAAALNTAGQGAFRRNLRAGIREIDLWDRVHTAMEAQGGVRIPVLVDLMFGERCLEVGLPPTDRVLAEGELGLCDLAPRLDGYWADSCVTICAGTPTRTMRRLHDTAMRALDAGIRAARPGVTAGELDGIVRGVMQEGGYEYPHHTGHGVGVAFHEEPRIVPGSDQVLAEGMVIALEPGAYVDGSGIRVEHVMVVRPDGGEVLTEYSLDLTQE